MSKSYRIRTQVGVDKKVNVLLEQDFESLEILSLKILQNQIYTRQCSDYGVVVGRVSANNGFGLPNVKVSIFIPLSEEDEINPLISELYPYKTLNDLNEDGYRYNLLPYEVSHGGHNPTGTFPSREDVLINQGLIEVFDKYYKYTAKTNESGDFMFFGVPIGPQTLHMDVDLSDIGEFSLSPQDLIRLNLATENQVDGTKFRSSTNLGELPQIKQANRTVEVVPLWGQPEICYLGITRVDFDLSQEFGIKIEPAAVFMGSIFSNTDENLVKRNCKVSKKIGNMCSMVAGPGQILSIRQTIESDSLGRPLLETFPLENGGNCIDENGTWLVDLPMNLDYVYTSESGERLISTDPSVGIPTKARYRFKVKWQQPPTITGKILRGTYLVPNIKEWGWEERDEDPTVQSVSTLEAILGVCSPPETGFTSSDSYQAVKSSYSFSLDWDDYGAGPNSNVMIDEAIRCLDRFFEFKHSKVYTVSSLITEFRASPNNNYRYLAIKDILNSECESTTNIFPANDGQKNNDIIYLLFTLLLSILIPVMFIVIILGHIISLVVCILAFVIGALKLVVCGLADAFCWLANDAEIPVINVRPFGFLRPFCRLFETICEPLEDAYDKMMEFCGGFGINLPVMVYPDCDFCPCEDPSTEPTPTDLSSLGFPGLEQSLQNAGGTSLLADFHSPSKWDCNRVPQYWGYVFALNNYAPVPSPISSETIEVYLGSLQTGQPAVNAPLLHAPQMQTIVDNDGDPDTGVGDAPNQVDSWSLFTTSIPFFERANLLNTKAKYFNESLSNPGGGVNRIQVKFASDNPINTLPHTDNVLILFVKKSQIDTFESGKIFTPVQKNNSQDGNLILTGLTGFTQFGNAATTGTTLGSPITDSDGDITHFVNNITVNYANPDGSGNLSRNYTVSAATGDLGDGQNFYKFPSDIEYFQSITAMTVADFKTLSVSNVGGIRGRIIDSYMDIVHDLFADGGGFIGGALDTNNSTSLLYDPDNNGAYGMGGSNSNPLRWDCLNDSNEIGIVFLVRGVDPYSTRQTCSYDLSRLFGYSSFGQPGLTVEGQFKLNIPIQGRFRNVRHNTAAMSTNASTDSYSSTNLFYPSYSFRPDPLMYESYVTSATSFYIYGDSSAVVPAGSTNEVGTFGLKIRNTNWYTLVFAHRWAVNTDVLNPPYNIYLTDVSAQGSVNGRFLARCKSAKADQQNNYDYNTTSNGRNRGYFADEIVEGAGAMYGDFSNYQPNHTPYAFLGATIGYETTCRADTGSITSHYYSYSYRSYLSLSQYQITMSNSERIVMRADRLPTSSVEQTSGNFSYGLHANQNFTLFEVDDDGYVQSTGIGSGDGPPSEVSVGNNPTLSGAGNTFTCEGMIPLACYRTDSEGFVTVAPANDGCYTNVSKEPYIVGGCYRLIQVPIVSLIKDFQLLAEWAARTKLGFAACRNIYGLLFTNYWVNGTLYMFPIKNSVRFTGPNAEPPNTAYACICPDVMFVDNETNNAYYRSAPYRYNVPGSSNGFIGKAAPINFGGSNSEDKPNYTNLLFPTTIMDLGPRTKYTSELVLSDEYIGYVMDRLSTTSYQDTSDLLNQFIMSRLVSQTLIGLIVSQLVPSASLAADPVRRMFSRGFNKVDGDYAQMVAINSQIGVFGYDEDEYLAAEPTAEPSAPSGYVYVNPSNSRYNVFGIFYKQNYQLRDWLSPHRLVTTATGITNNPCTYENYPIFTQTVPFYQWYIQPNRDGDSADSIFGDQWNDWWSPQFAGGPDTFLTSPYQGMDRLNTEFMQPNDDTRYGYHGGYLFNVTSGEIDSQPPNPAGMPVYPVGFNPDGPVGTQNFDARIMTPSGPYYFYFGLSRGKSAFDRFLTKWVQSDVFEI